MNLDPKPHPTAPQTRQEALEEIERAIPFIRTAIARLHHSEDGQTEILETTVQHLKTYALDEYKGDLHFGVYIRMRASDFVSQQKTSNAS